MRPLTVIIPAYNRAERLARVLAALAAQSYPLEAVEVIVVDDGSSDGTPAVVQAATREATFRLRYHRQENRGPAAARNVGIAMASHPLLVFLGDDTIPAPECLAAHASYHENHAPCENLAVVGSILWPPGFRPTPFLRFIATHGPQFNYVEVKENSPLSYRFFYTSDLSLQRSLLERLPYAFDEDFRAAMWEDVELAYRLEQAGLLLHYCPRAVVYHDHPTSVAQCCRRFRMLGKVSRMVLRKHPELEPQLRSTGQLRAAARCAFGIRPAISVADYLDSTVRLPLPRFIYWGILGACYAIGATETSGA
jgi:GT2 family glycosyltransferase